LSTKSDKNAQIKDSVALFIEIIKITGKARKNAFRLANQVIEGKPQ